MINNNEIFKKFINENNIDEESYGFILKNNVLYVNNKIYEIPIVRKVNDVYFFKELNFKLLKLLLNNNIREDSIFIVNELFPEKSTSTNDEYHSENIELMLMFFYSNRVFNKLNNINFDFIKNLYHYIDYNDCFDQFKKQHNIFIKRYQTSIKQNISEYFSNIERKIKINILFKGNISH